MSGTDYFITYSQADKIKLLQGLTQAIVTGQIVRVKTSRDAETEFNPNVSNELTYERLCTSIANSPDYDATDPIQLAAANNARPSQTQPFFC